MTARHNLSLIFFLLLCCTGYLAAQDPIGGDRGVRQSDPVLSADGNTLYFCRPDHARNQGNDQSSDIWTISRKEDGSWGRAMNPGSPINSFAGDRPLHLSVDGNRIAVLRQGKATSIELLERGNRNWRLAQRWSLPEGANAKQLTFNANSLQLVYAGEGAGMLYRSEALPAGQWGQAVAMKELTAVSDSPRPTFSPDGRTLYYRSTDNRWMMQPDRGQAASPTNIPPRYLQLSIAGEQAVVMTDDLGADERLFNVTIPAEEGLPAYTLTQGRSAISPDGDHLATRVPLNNGTELSVYPDAAKQYTLALRANEVIFSDNKVPRVNTSKRAGGLAGQGEAGKESREEYLQKRLTRQEDELAQLDDLRSRNYLLADTDTLPPSASNDTRTRYAKDLEELERMKEKFRQQQERKLHREDRGGTLMLDSTDVRTGVRSGLYPDQRPAAYERRSWENNISEDLPATTVKGGEESTLIDAAYDKKLREVEALRAQLQQARGGGTVPPAPSETSGLSIAFIPNTAYPNSDGYGGLDALVTYVKQAASVVEIRVHTGRELDARAAQLLSEERATTIRDYLNGAGIAAANFRVIGFGNHESAAGERVELVTAQ